MKTLDQLQSYDSITQAKTAFEDAKRQLKIDRSQLTNLRKKISDAQLRYDRQLRDESVSYDDVEQLDKDIEQLKNDIGQKSQAIKKLESELPSLEKQYQKAGKRFFKDATPIVDSAIDEMKQRLKAVQEINEYFFYLKRQASDTSLNKMPGISEILVNRLPDIMEYQQKMWEQWKQRQ